MTTVQESQQALVTEVGGAAGYCLFDTEIGTCGVGWTDRGIASFQLPERTRHATQYRLQRRVGVEGGPCDPPPAVQAASALVRRYMTGERTDFSKVELDLAGVGDFHQRIYAVLRGVGWGETATYGDLAKLVGVPGAARAVGQAMGQNPIPVIIPCHRVLASGRKIGGFSAFGGAVTKERLLEMEGVHLGSGQLALPGLLSARR